jgi:hypothetical protein
MRYRVIGGCWLGLAGILSAGNLTFPEVTKEINPGVDATKVTADFKFTNQTDKPVTIAKYDAGCSCMSVQIADGKRVYAPGESGVLRANFDMGNFSGSVDKNISVWLDGDAETAPSEHLTVRVNIPVLVELEPKTVKWEVNGATETKTIEIKMNGDKPIHISSVSPSSESFSHELKTLEDGKRYQLVITPKSTAAPGIAIFRIQTDCEIQRHALQQGFAVISRPAPAAPAK